MTTAQANQSSGDSLTLSDPASRASASDPAVAYMAGTTMRLNQFVALVVYEPDEAAPTYAGDRLPNTSERGEQEVA